MIVEDVSVETTVISPLYMTIQERKTEQND
jgi:hypothetical protein